MMPELARHATTAVDVNKYVMAGARIYGIAAEGISHFELASYLGSFVGDFFVKHIAAVYGSGFYSYGDQFIKDLPIPSTTAAQQQTIAGLAQSLTEKTAQLRQREKQVQAFPASVTQLRFEQGNPPDLEDLSRLIITSNLAKTLDSQKLSQQTTLTGETVLNLGRGELRGKTELMALVSRVLELRGKMSSEELLALEVPLHPHDQTDYLQTLTDWQNDIATLQQDIDGLEIDLNSTVYDAYQLTDTDRDVVEGFLERF